MKTTNYSPIYRIIHWAVAITFLLLLVTIFLRITWMNKYHMADIIQDYLNSTDQSLSREQIVAMAKQIRKPMWDWHIYLGYILVGLFAIRFTLPFFDEMKFQSPLNKNLSAKQRFQKWTYIIFYICVIVSLVTGILIEWGPKDWKKPLEEIHVLGIYYLVAFIVLHLAGIIYAEFTDQKGIVSRIIGGGERSR
ncbi:cytochrome b/b6 domain-containing protein [Aequorivita sp. H23M31]|uniref:Cytochrome b/b6 domain-containing protein n=1 Tax=Aequorivita ciconiae TaxID=2494375 RepID=A0A410G1F9_9FLAO|nr:cytochrome b/b6 domain-containing protein [Aequorivita sp. H23M31]QAA81108.1 cytochrome b/b6 domain-containing protein [Aequorivita sp. H23M31]